MPWEQHWVPAPSNMRLPVLDSPPEGAVDWTMLDGVKRVRVGIRPFYFCNRTCKGWIEGHTNEYRVDTLGPLSGRRGIEVYCARCGQEIGFTGMMS